MIHEPQLRNTISFFFTDRSEEEGGSLVRPRCRLSLCKTQRGASLCTSHSRRPWRRRSCKPGCRHQTRLKQKLSPSHTAQIQPPKLAPTNKHMLFLVPEHSCACRQSATTTTLVGSAIPNPGRAPGAPEWPHCAPQTEGM